MNGTHHFDHWMVAVHDLNKADMFIDENDAQEFYDTSVQEARIRAVIVPTYVFEQPLTLEKIQSLPDAVHSVPLASGGTHPFLVSDKLYRVLTSYGLTHNSLHDYVQLLTKAEMLRLEDLSKHKLGIPLQDWRGDETKETMVSVNDPDRGGSKSFPVSVIRRLQNGERETLADEPCFTIPKVTITHISGIVPESRKRKVVDGQ